MGRELRRYKIKEIGNNRENCEEIEKISCENEKTMKNVKNKEN